MHICDPCVLHTLFGESSNYFNCVDRFILRSVCKSFALYVVRDADDPITIKYTLRRIGMVLLDNIVTRCMLAISYIMDNISHHPWMNMSCFYANHSMQDIRSILRTDVDGVLSLHSMDKKEDASNRCKGRMNKIAFGYYFRRFGENALQVDAIVTIDMWIRTPHYFVCGNY